MGKREYIEPSVQVIEVQENSMICTSVVIIDDVEVDEIGRGQKKRGAWGNFWYDGVDD